ncbi:hypothetical protein CUMW_035520 [Citrus unshiu]|nr:hypothetical protein CUMW_035520 [Citrus unshiu]
MGLPASRFQVIRCDFLQSNFYSNLTKTQHELQLVELKEAEEKSFKESERLEKEIAEVQEMKRKISTMTADEYVEKHPETSVLWMLVCLRDSCAIRFMKSNCDNMLLDLDWKAGGGGTKKCGKLRV